MPTPNSTPKTVEEWLDYHRSNNVLSDHSQLFSSSQSDFEQLDESGIGVFIYDFSIHKYLFLSKQCEKILGFPLKNFLEGGVTYLVGLIHKDDREKVMAITHWFYEKVMEFPLEDRLSAIGKLNYRIVNANGEHIWILQQSRVARLDANGFPALDFGMVTDITALKKDISISGNLCFKNGKEIQINPSSLLKTKSPATEREIEILRFLDNGLTSKQIAWELKLSPETVNRHRKNILKKTEASNMIEAIRKAKEAQWI